MACGFSEDALSCSLVPKRGRLTPSEEERARRVVSSGHESKRSIDGPPAARCCSSRHVDHGQRDYGFKPGDSRWTGGSREGPAETRGHGSCLGDTCPRSSPPRADESVCAPPGAAERRAAAQQHHALCGTCASDGDGDGGRNRSAEYGAASATEEVVTGAWSWNCQRHRHGCTSAQRKMDPPSSSIQRIRGCDGAGCASRDTGGAGGAGGRGGGDGGSDCWATRASTTLRAAALPGGAEGTASWRAWSGRGRGGACAWRSSPLRWSFPLNLPLLLLLRLLLLDCVLASPSVTSPGAPSPVRINCGASEHLTGSDGRVWEPDAFFAGGEMAAVLNASQLGFPKEVASQRIFHTGDVSCYDIPLPLGRFIVRLAFAYHSETLPAKTFETVSSVTVQGGRTSSAQDFSVSATSALTDAAATREGSLMASAVGAAHLVAPAAAPAASAAAVVSRLPHDTPFSAAPNKGPLGSLDSQGMPDLTPGVSESESGDLGALREKVQGRWPRFAVLVEGVQMETVSMGQHVGAVYEPEYIVDSADASLTLCFLPVWGHALVNSIEILPVPQPFYLLPSVVPPNAFLAVRARIDCGRAAWNHSGSTEAPSQPVGEGAGTGLTPSTRTERVNGDVWGGESNGTARGFDLFNQSVAASMLATAPDGRGLMDAVGRRWVSDLSQIASNHELPAPNGLHDSLGNASRFAVTPPKSFHTALPVSGAGEAPLFLAQALLQTAREAVLASGLHYSFSFRVPARLNRWVVLLHFVAVQLGSRVGERVFDIHVNGVTVSGFDILREAHGQHNRLVTLPVVVGFSRPAIGSAPTLEVQLVACNGSRLSPLISSIEIIEVVRANVPRENVVSELQAQQKTAGSQASPEAAPSRSSRTGVVAGAIGGVGALVFLALMVPLLLLWRHQHRRRHAMRSQLLEEGVLDSAAAHLEDSAVGPEPPVVGEEVDALVDSGEGSVDFDR